MQSIEPNWSFLICLFQHNGRYMYNDRLVKALPAVTLAQKTVHRGDACIHSFVELIP